VLALRVGDYLRLGSMTELLQRIILHIAKYIALDFASRPLSLDSESPIIVVQFLEVNGVIVYLNYRLKRAIANFVG
jgi:hypothetical protein